MTRGVAPGVSAGAAQHSDRVVDEALAVELLDYRRGALIESSLSHLLIRDTQIPIRLAAADAILREQCIEPFIEPNPKGFVIANNPHCFGIANILVTVVVQCVPRGDGDGTHVVDAEGELPGHEVATPLSMSTEPLSPWISRRLSRS